MKHALTPSLVVAVVAAASLFTLPRLASACSPSGCGQSGGGVQYNTCNLTGGGSITVQCIGGACPQRQACGKCDVMNGSAVVSCGCVCVPCTNCLPEDP